MSIAPALGPLVAGTILTYASWRWLFIAILPFTVLCLVLGHRCIRVPSTPKAAKLDLLSVALSTLGFGGLVYGLATLGEGGGEHGMISPWLSMSLGGLVVVAFVLRQLQLQKSDSAQLDMRPFANRTFAATIMIALLFLAPAFGTQTLLPFVLQTSYGLSTFEAGMFMAPAGITIAIASVVVGRLYDRFGPRPLMIGGAAIDAVALWFLSTMSPGTPVWMLNMALILIVGAQAFVWTPIFAAALGSVKEHLVPHGSAILNTVQQLTGAAGIAIMFSIMGAIGSYLTAQGQAENLAMAHGAQQAFQVGSIMVIAALVLIVCFIPRRVLACGAAVAAHRSYGIARRDICPSGLRSFSRKG